MATARAAAQNPCARVLDAPKASKTMSYRNFWLYVIDTPRAIPPKFDLKPLLPSKVFGLCDWGECDVLPF